MSYLKFLPIALFIACQATFMMIIEPSLGFVSWIAFQSWAVYFLAGCNFQGGIKTLICYFGGAIASIVIMEGAAFFANSGLGSGINLYLAVFIVVVLVLSCERIPAIDFIPAWFIGAGVFFGLMNLDTFAAGATAYERYMQTTGNLMYGCAVGLVFGFVTVTFRSWYEPKVARATKVNVTADIEEIETLS